MGRVKPTIGLRLVGRLLLGEAIGVVVRPQTSRVCPNAKWGGRNRVCEKQNVEAGELSCAGGERWER